MDLDDDDDLIGSEVEGEENLSPFDPTKIKIDDRKVTIDLVLSRIKHGEIDLSP